jgi:hypothetical protein
MEKDIAEGKIGEVGAYDVEFKEGKLVAKVNAGVPAVGLEAEMKISLGADQVLDALAKAIPGTIDDALLGLIKGALKL